MTILRKVSYSLLLILLVGLFIPERIIIPVKGATPSDWHHQTFWFEPWGSSGVHKGIDIFGHMGKPVITPVDGIVIFSGNLSKGGQVVAILGPKWRVHYLAHLDSYSVSAGSFVSSGSLIGTLGDTGNAKGKPPHVHYSIVSLIPVPWLATTETQGWKKMFFLNPHQALL